MEPAKPPPPTTCLESIFDEKNRLSNNDEHPYRKYYMVISIQCILDGLIIAIFPEYNAVIPQIS